jgi:hypothetical protein
MTALRSQIHSAARAYRAARYPGDLAADVLPRANKSTSGVTYRSTFSRIGAAITALAAVVLLAVFLRPAPSPSTPAVTSAGGGNLVAVALPLDPPTTVPVPTIHVPSFPQRVPDPLPRDIDVHGYRMRYDDLAQQVPKITPSIRHLTVPKLSDLPDKGLDWLQKVWTADESA